MLMVIFGAGASYDALPTRPLDRFPNMDERLPLANDLFADRPHFARCLTQFSECLDIVPRLLGPFGNGSGPASIEAALEDLQNEASMNARRYSQLAAVRFYIQKVIWDTNAMWNSVAQGMTNYRSLIDKIVHWNQNQQPVWFVTFNYDTMLELALEHFGFHLNGMAHYVEQNVFRVIKAHGSVNWVRVVNKIGTSHRVYPGPDSFVPKRLIECAADTELSDEFQLVKNYTVGRLGMKPVFPAIAIPVQTKTSFECPKYHLDLLKQWAPGITKLLIVGWRGAEAHFRKLLSDSLRERAVRTLIVDPDPGASRTILLRTSCSVHMSSLGVDSRSSLLRIQE
jgi:hypothetical protein